MYYQEIYLARKEGKKRKLVRLGGNPSWASSPLAPIGTRANKVEKRRIAHIQIAHGFLTADIAHVHFAYGPFGALPLCTHTEANLDSTDR